MAEAEIAWCGCKRLGFWAGAEERASSGGSWPSSLMAGACGHGRRARASFCDAGRALRRLRRLHARATLPTGGRGLSTSARRTWADHVELYGPTVAGTRAGAARLPVSRPGRRSRASTISRPGTRGLPQLHGDGRRRAGSGGGASLDRPPVLPRDVVRGSGPDRGSRVSTTRTDNLSEPGVFYVGQHHAREHLTVEVVLSLLHLYTDRARRAPRTRSGTSSTRARSTSCPSLNPDGAEYDIADGLLPLLAQEPAAELAGDRHGQQPQLHLPVGLLRRVGAATAAARPTAARTRCRRPRTSGWPISWSPIRTSRPESATTPTAT